MPEIKPDIIAEVQFYSTECGGREKPIPASANRFACPMAINNELFDCWLLLDQLGVIAPGDTVKVPIKFTLPDVVLDLLHENDNFELWPVATVAKGKVLKICDSK